jgi:transposase
MAKTIDIIINESEEQLKYLLRKQDKLLQQGRVKALLLIKQGKARYTYELSEKLKRGRKTIYNWLQLYQEQGLEGYLTVASRGKRKDKLSESEKQAIAQKLQDASTGITSYVELCQWAEFEFRKEVPYHVIYNYCRSRLNSRLKIARKSHHKKDEQAVEAFKKTALSD